MTTPHSPATQSPSHTPNFAAEDRVYVLSAVATGRIVKILSDGDFSIIFDDGEQGYFSAKEIVAVGIIAAAPETAADRDRLRGINGKLLESAKEALALLEYMAADRKSALNHKTLAGLRAAIARATGK